MVLDSLVGTLRLFFHIYIDISFNTLVFIKTTKLLLKLHSTTRPFVNIVDPPPSPTFNVVQYDVANIFHMNKSIGFSIVQRYRGNSKDPTTICVFRASTLLRHVPIFLIPKFQSKFQGQNILGQKKFWGLKYFWGQNNIQGRSKYFLISIHFWGQNF